MVKTDAFLGAELHGWCSLKRCSLPVLVRGSCATPHRARRAVALHHSHPRHRILQLHQQAKIQTGRAATQANEVHETRVP